MSRISRIVQRLKEHKRQLEEKQESDTAPEREPRLEDSFSHTYATEEAQAPSQVEHGWDVSSADVQEVAAPASGQLSWFEAQAMGSAGHSISQPHNEQTSHTLAEQASKPHADTYLAPQPPPYTAVAEAPMPRIDPRLAPRQEQLRGDPFAIRCPYSGLCGLMEARDLPRHAQEWHLNDEQAYACSICMLSAEDQSLVERNNLIQHLQTFHSDCIPSWEDDPVATSLTVDMRKLKVAGAFVEDVMHASLAKECPICFDEFRRGDTVYRMDCWCLFHKRCAQSWFDKVGNCKCPVHSD